MMSLGLYISVPFCRTKCSYCNFASDVFSRAVFGQYVDRVCADIARARDTSAEMGARFEADVDTIYLGGGTPTVLESQQLERLFVTIRQNFCLAPGAEITVECAPGTLSPTVLDTLLSCGVNRVSLGVQSFIDQEAAAVGRLHKRETVLHDIARLRAAGVTNINVDLIAGLPHQTAASWDESVRGVTDSGVPHASVYMLEVDEDSRLGRELMAGGSRYHAHFVPDDDLTADLYVAACGLLDGAGVKQYEISNFARPGFESQHNLKYWTRQPYLGFGVDAHSMLEAGTRGHMRTDARGGADREGCDFKAVAGGAGTGGHDFSRAASGYSKSRGFSPGGPHVRLATADSLEQFMACAPLKTTPVEFREALEETFFLGLRMTRGVDLIDVSREYGAEAVNSLMPIISELEASKLLVRDRNVIRLTPRGRLLSNEVFERFISPAERV